MRFSWVLGSKVEVYKIAVSSGEFVCASGAENKGYQNAADIFESYCVSFRESRNYGVTNFNATHFWRAGNTLLALWARSEDDGCHTL